MAKAVRSVSTYSKRPQGRPPSDAGLLAIAATMAADGEAIVRLRAEREELADGHDKRSLSWSRYLLAEAADRWWDCVDRIAALPARGWAGMRAKAETILAVAAEREVSDRDDIVATDTLCRLAVSLADDVGRWSRRRT